MLERFLRNIRPRWSPTLYKAALVGAVGTALVIPIAIAAMPFIEFLNGMAAQSKAKSQSTYGRVFGSAIVAARPAPEGTLPRGYEPYRFDTLGDSIVHARVVGDSLANPVRPTMENLKQGQKIYNIFCIACHGDRALGNGPVTGPNRFPAPPSLHTTQAREYKDGTIFHIITKGMGKMPGYADKIDSMDRWKVIQYVRALQRAENPRKEDL